MIPYEPPAFHLDAFNCPHCNAYSEQTWSPTRFYRQGSHWGLDDLLHAFCSHCRKYSLWHFEKMIYPEDAGVPPPNPDLTEDIIADYSEAKGIVNKSPRGAAALLRLCVQKLCVQLGEKGNNINTDIANLVKIGLPVEIQQSLDIVRVIGNNAVHPGEIDISDDTDTALKLFELVNVISDVMITQKKKIKELYESLPKSKLKAIEERDKGKSTSSDSE